MIRNALRSLATAGALLFLCSCGGKNALVSSCPPERVVCSDACIDLKTDDANCGGCGAACASGTACANGTCVATSCGTTACNAGQVCLDDACVDKSCVGVICPAGQQCAAGACVCQAGKEQCSGACVNTQLDNANCGSCGHACAAGTSCAVGNCFSTSCGTTTCDPGFICAQGQCVEAACAAVTCMVGKECVGGLCQCTGPACECASDSQCPEASPHCDRTAGKCVQCVQSDDCASGEICKANLCTAGCSMTRPTCPAGQSCDFASNTCIDCATNAQCGVGKICGPAKLCVDGCAADHLTCTPGTLCDLASSACVQCLSSTDCAAGKVCDTTGKCVDGCSATRPCLGGKTCDTVAGVCVDCLSDANCTQTGFPACELTTHTCVQCRANQHCTNSAAPTCDTASHQCVPCVQSSDCPAGYLCTNRACVAGCDATRPVCPTGQTCDVMAGRCVECTTNLDCNASRPVCDVANRRCVQCLPGATNTCPSGTFCDVNTCRSGCASNADCPSGKRCQTNSHFCVDCLSNSDCTTDAGVARTCTSWGTCSVACTSAASCASGELCCGSSCTRPLTDQSNCGGCGQACLPGQQCLGGICQRYLAGLSMTVQQNDSNGAVLYTSIDPSVDHCADLTFPDCQWTPMDWASSYVAWTGFLNIPVDGTWGIATTSKNGSRVFIDGVQVLSNNWNTSVVNARLLRDNRNYTAGLHALRVEFQSQGVPGSGIALQWAPPGGGLQVVPQSALVYQGPCVYGETSCNNSCTNMLYDDNNCGGCGAACSAGNRCIAGACRPTISGLATRYYDRPDYWFGSLTMQHLEPRIDNCDNYALLACSWAPLDYSGYGVTFSGMLFAPEDGSYDLGAVGADGWRITVDGRTLASVNYIGSAQAVAQRKSNRLLLNRGLHTISVEFWAATGGAPRGVTLFWKRPSGLEEVVPSTYLYTSGPCSPGEQLCGTSCANLATSNTHCGVCNNLCVNGTQCLDGSCAPMLPGLAARYYDRPDYWFGTLLYDRLEPNVDTCTNWTAYDCSWSPMSWTGYGVTWSGYLQIPQDGAYRFSVTGADGWRLTVDGYRIQQYNYIGSGISSPARSTNTQTLQKGLQPITLEYWASGGGAPHGVTLAWAPPGQAMTPIPPSNLFAAGPCAPGETACGGVCSRLSSSSQNCGNCGIACGAGNRCVAGQCVPVIPGLYHRLWDRPDYWYGSTLASSTEPQLAYCNNPASLDCSWAPFTWTQFAGTWEGLLDVPTTGTYGLHVTGSDGWRMYIDGRNVNQFNYIGTAQAQARTQSVNTALTQGMHTVSMDYWAAAGGAPRGIDLSWTLPGGTARASVPQTAFAQRGPCQPGKVVCSGTDGGSTCATLGTDDANCGACGVTCGAGTRCIAASCTPVKNGLSATYYDRADYWNGTLLFSRADPDIHTCNDFTSLDCSWAPITWSAYGTQWRGYLDIRQPGTYELGAVAKDSVLVNLDGREIVKFNWGGSAQPGASIHTARTTLNAGLHPIVIGYQSFQGAVPGNGIDFIWKRPGQAAFELVPGTNLYFAGPCFEGSNFCGGQCTYDKFDVNNCGGCGNGCGSSAGCIAGICRPLTAGLEVRWWTNVSASGTPVATTNVTQVNSCNVTNGVCTGTTPAGQTAPYRAIHRGVLFAPQSGTYKLTLSSRAGSQLQLDGRTIINNNFVTSQDAFVKKSGITFLAQGYHDLVVDTFGFQTSGVGVDLSWTVPGSSTEVLVPAANLWRY